MVHVQAALGLILETDLARPMTASDAAAMLRNVARDVAGMAQARAWLLQSWQQLQAIFGSGCVPDTACCIWAVAESSTDELQSFIQPCKTCSPWNVHLCGFHLHTG